MESPPSSSTWSERFILSDDSGLLLTNSSISSGSSSKSGRNRLPLEDSDCDDDKSFSQDSLDGMSDIICGENFNTLKKGPNCMDYTLIKYSSPIEPPLEFQDQPELIENFSNQLAKKLLKDAIYQLREDLLNQIKYEQRSIQLLNRSYYTSEFIQFSPCHHHQHHHHYNHHYYNYHSSSNNSNGRPGSRSSLGSSRLSSSHNSLSVPSAHKVDDSSFITQAVSHDTLSTNQISDLYNVPFDSDVYAVPIDMIKPPPPLKPRRNQQQQQQQQTKKRRRNTSSGCREIEGRQIRNLSTSKRNIIKFDKLQYQWCLQKNNKRHSVAGSSGDGGTAPGGGGGSGGGNEPIHMTLQEVRHYLQTLYSSSSDSSDHKEKQPQIKQKSVIETTDDKINNENNTNGVVAVTTTTTSRITNGRLKKNTFLINIKNKKIKDSCDNSHVSKKIDTANNNNNNYSNNNKLEKVKKSPPKLFSFKQTLCNMFRFKRFLTPEHIKCDKNTMKDNNCNNISIDETLNNITSRALPPLPQKDEDDKISTGEQQLDFATSIQRVKDYGWYWGPLSGEVAEKILSNEPDGSFIVRDSSDDHYIFSLTFKLNNCVRHVRIDHDQGNFSFGSCTKFKSQTIVEFIENAVEHSRSGRYLFFLHRRPVIGPVRVQLLHPVSRFKQVQSLQHICRFVIHKNVRRDLITNLPLPRRMIDYLNTPHYYSEHLIDIEDTTNSEQTTTRVPTPAIRRDYRDNDDDDGENDSQIPINNYIVLNNNNNDPNDNDNVSRQS